jgi:anti-sigma regulatory factor (Ser/Thr protein kinase)
VFEQADVRTSGPEPVFSPSEWAVEIHDVHQATRIRRAFRDYLMRYAAPESDVAAAELIFGELLGNVVRYAPGPALFRLHWHGARPKLLVTDGGPGFARTPEGSLGDGVAEQGRGLALVRAFAVRLIMGNRKDGGAYVSVVLPVRRRQATA